MGVDWETRREESTSCQGSRGFCLNTKSTRIYLAFQAPFPYVRNEASLRAARARRVIARRLTEFWFGTDHAATTLDIRCDAEGRIFVTQLIEGEVPKDKRQPRAFLRKIAPRFQEVGLPTWQVDPLNPKAPGWVSAVPCPPTTSSGAGWWRRRTHCTARSCWASTAWAASFPPWASAPSSSPDVRHYPHLV